MIMGQDLNKIEKLYDTVAKPIAERFLVNTKKNRKIKKYSTDFSIEIGDKNAVWDFGCGPRSNYKYLKDLGIEISGWTVR